MIGALTDPANLSGQVVSNFGILTGPSGITVDRGSGDDTYMEGGTMTGEVVLGESEDTVSLDIERSGELTGGLIDGGAGIDTMSILAFRLTDVLTPTSLPDGMFRLGLGRDVSATAVRFARFETFRSKDGQGGAVTCGLANLGPVASVPLPAADRLLLVGIGGFAIACRRAKGPPGRGGPQSSKNVFTACRE